MWIAGDFDVQQIRCCLFAKTEVEKLALKAKASRDASFFASDEYIYLTFLNTRSLRKHHKDISNDEELMRSEVIGMAETHLHEDETVKLEGFEGNYLVNAGKGKGVAAFSRNVPIDVIKIKKETFSAIFLSFENFRIVFGYLSKGVNINEFNTIIVPLLQDKTKNTIFMGDMNYHYLEERNALRNMFDKIDYVQMIDKVTHDDGHILDHVYISSPEILLKEDIYLKSLYFSDHDAACIRFKKAIIM